LARDGEKYSDFDHTADLGIEFRGADLRELFQSGAAALLALALDPAAVEDREALALRVEGIDLEDVLVNWLREVLYWAQSERFAPREVRVDRVTETFAEGEIRGEPFDPRCHVQREELKGVTRHGVRVESEDGGFVARVVIDV
jgi:SHS2 domain-containing protein